MDRETARREIKDSWRRIYPADRKGKGIICPLCGSGSGKNGTGITEDPDKPGQLRCWNGGCDFQGGDVIDLYMQKNGVGYNEAFSSLAEMLGIEVDTYKEYPTPQTTAKATTNKTTQTTTQKAAKNDLKTPENKSGLELFQYDPERAETVPKGDAEGGGADYTEYYKQCYKRRNDTAALLYLKNRGIPLHVAAIHYIGYDPEWISPTAVKRKQAEGKDWKPVPTRRIIIPVTTTHYIARAIDPDIDPRFKKMNEGSPGIFNEKVLYSGSRPVFVTEGVFDALSIEACSYRAIALNSTSNARKLLKKLQGKRIDALLILCLDNDDSGKKTTEILQQGLTELNILFTTADINGIYKDPNEHLTGNREEFEKALKEAEQRAEQMQPAADPEGNPALKIFEGLDEGEAKSLAKIAELLQGLQGVDSFSEVRLNERLAHKEIERLFNPRGANNQDGDALPGMLTYNDAVNIFQLADDRIIKFKSFPTFGKTAKIKLHDSVVIAADTGAGKSSLAINFLNDLNNEYPVIYFNLEMDSLTILRRLVAIYSGIELDIIEGYQHDEKTRAAVNKALQVITARQPLQILKDVYSLEKIEATIKHATQNREEPTIVIVDHSLLVKTEAPINNRYERFTHISEELRRMSRTYNIILFILLQQNREGKKDDTEPPTNSSLKESGSWENDATQIVFLWYDPAIKRKKLLITKNRNGDSGEFPLNYWKKTQTYTEMQAGTLKTAPAVTEPHKQTKREKQKQKLITAFEDALITTNGHPTIQAMAEAADVTTSTIKSWIKEYGGCTVDGIEQDPAGINTTVDYTGFVKLTPADNNPFDDPGETGQPTETRKQGRQR